VGERLGMAAKQTRHLLELAKAPFDRAFPPEPGGLDGAALADADDDVLQHPLVRVVIEQVPGNDAADAYSLRHVLEQAIQPLELRRQGWASFLPRGHCPADCLPVALQASHQLGVGMGREITKPQRVLRLFAVLMAGCDRLARPGPQGEVAIFRGEKRLHALMFWLRNPDYLAWELLDLHDADHDPAWVVIVEEMFAAEEPILRRDAMRKYLFGAHEPLDDDLAVLSTDGLVRPVLKMTGLKVAEHDFLIFPDAFARVSAITGLPLWDWYADRMQLVLHVADGRSGSALKVRQYEHVRYATTANGSPIPAITDQVLARLRSLSEVA
jgi:hypothetical protein